MAIARKALQSCNDEEAAEEATLLNLLLKNKEFHPKAIQFFNQSPSFIKEFQKQNPEKTQWVLPEYVISQQSSEQPQTYLQKFPTGIIPPITKQLLEEMEHALSQTVQPLEVQIQTIKEHFSNVYVRPNTPTTGLETA